MLEVLREPVRIRIASTPAQLPIVRAVVGRLTRLVGFDQEASDRITLAVDEALTNVIRHAYHGRPDGPIEITFRRAADARGAAALCIELRDWGTQVEPDQIRPRRLEELRPGGLGVHIITSVMDEVQYAPVPSGGTRLTMTKTLSRELL